MEMELLNIALHAAHPVNQGWLRLRGCVLDEIEVDMFFYRKGEPPVAVLLMDTPYVSGADLKMASHVQSIYTQKMNGRKVKVMMVYRNLLFRPQRVPNDVYVMSVFDTTQEAEQPASLKN